MQAVLAEVFEPLDPAVNVVPRLLQRAGTQRNNSFATIVRVLFVGYPAVFLEIGYDPADGRDGNAGHPVKGGHGTGASFEVATDDLIHYAQLIECTVAPMLLGQRPQQTLRKFDNGRNRYIGWFVRHTLVAFVASFDVSLRH